MKYLDFVIGNYIAKQPRFDSFLIGGWNNVLSAGDISRLANPTLLS